MKRLNLILVIALLVVGLLTSCDLSQKEGQIVFSLEEDPESACTWEYFIEPQGVIEKVRDELYPTDGELLRHDWIFKGTEVGEVAIIFQYSEEGKDPIRTVRYSCFVDENMHVNLLETADSALSAGTGEDELLIRCISTAISLQFETGMTYPSRSVSQEYAQAFLNCYANLFYSELSKEYDEITETEYKQYIALDENMVSEILSIAFGSRFGTDVLSVDHNALIFNAHKYYFAAQDHAWVDMVPLEEEMQYVFTLIGTEESIDGTAQVTVEETSQNSVGLALAAVSAQKNE